MKVSIVTEELNIKTIENNTIIFDYILFELCEKKNVNVEINNNTSKFKSIESSGTIEFNDNIVILNLKNKNYNEIFERTFIILK